MATVGEELTGEWSRYRDSDSKVIPVAEARETGVVLGFSQAPLVNLNRGWLTMIANSMCGEVLEDEGSV